MIEFNPDNLPEEENFKRLEKLLIKDLNHNKIKGVEKLKVANFKLSKFTDIEGKVMVQWELLEDYDKFLDLSGKGEKIVTLYHHINIDL